MAQSSINARQKAQVLLFVALMFRLLLGRAPTRYFKLVNDQIAKNNYDAVSQLEVSCVRGNWK